MKKMITLLLILVLTLGLFAGCRSGNSPEDMVTEASKAVDDMMPKSDNGHATDGDGFIGDGNGRSGMNGGMLPNG
ncbi:MAG: hypothetical protein IJO72_04755 [Oscillospiraceae bacterium]|nr:hypothetical protein [Oscillospiraceae bacterium]MBQ9930070.1 hypothetical protein [Oscillospiraceae bacterium]